MVGALQDKLHLTFPVLCIQKQRQRQATEIEGFKAHLQKFNKNFGLSLYKNIEGENVPTRVGPAPLGGYLSYQFAPTEGNFKGACNVDMSKQCNSDSDLITIYLSFPLSLVFPMFNVTQWPFRSSTIL